MQQRKKVYGLLALWFTMAAAVVLVWLLNEQKKIASVYLIPVDGEMMAQDWDNFQLLIDSIQPFGLLYEPDTLGQKPEFGRLVGPQLSAKIASTYPGLANSITPDSLFQKALAISIRKMIDKLNEYNFSQLMQLEEKTDRLRTTALLSPAATRDSLLEAHHLDRKDLLGPQFFRIPNRYSDLLLRNINSLIIKYPNRHWVILVDIEKYPWLKKRLINDQRIEVLNEVDF